MSNADFTEYRLFRMIRVMWRRVFYHRTTASLPRVFLGLTEISGYYAQLSRGLRELGYEVTFVDLHQHSFEYGGDDQPFWARITCRCHRNLVGAQHGSKAQRLLWYALCAISQTALFVSAVTRHDVFVFGFMSKFIHYRELILLRLLGKRIIHVFHGSDSRPAYSCGCIVGAANDVAACVRAAAAQKAAIRLIENSSHVLVSHPSHCHFHERPVVRTTAIGLPTPRVDANTLPIQSNKNNVRLLHCPSDPSAKGSAAIREVVESIAASNYAVTYVEVSGRPNADVLNELATCDIVVDQIYSDAAASGLASEAAAFGRPTIIAGYVDEDTRSRIPRSEQIPVCYCHPSNLRSTLLRLIESPALREQIGSQAKAFVLSRTDHLSLPRRFAKLIEDDVPKDWLFNPYDIKHAYCAGMSEQAGRHSVRKVIEFGGLRALQLGDKPILEQSFYSYATKSDHSDLKAPHLHPHNHCPLV